MRTNIKKFFVFVNVHFIETTIPTKTVQAIQINNMW